MSYFPQYKNLNRRRELVDELQRLHVKTVDGKNVKVYDEFEDESIDIVLRDYGAMEPYELRELSHAERPWRDARGDLPNGASCNRVISQSEYSVTWIPPIRTMIPAIHRGDSVI